MRLLSLILAVVLSVPAWSAAAKKPTVVFRSELYQFNINQDERNPLPQRATAGLIEYDRAARTLALRLTVPKPKCPPGAKCAPVMPRPWDEVFEVVGVEGGPCGTKTIVAILPETSQSETRILEVRDNAEFYKNCKSARAVHPVEAKYTVRVMNRRQKFSQITSYFTGRRFIPVGQR